VVGLAEPDAVNGNLGLHPQIRAHLVCVAHRDCSTQAWLVFPTCAAEVLRHRPIRMPCVIDDPRCISAPRKQSALKRSMTLAQAYAVHPNGSTRRPVPSKILTVAWITNPPLAQNPKPHAV
jgi:hypothetical protein